MNYELDQSVMLKSYPGYVAKIVAIKPTIGFDMLYVLEFDSRELTSITLTQKDLDQQIVQVRNKLVDSESTPDKYWVVSNDSASGKKYTSFKEAHSAANRLANLIPGTKFFVMEAVEYVVANAVTVVKL